MSEPQKPPKRYSFAVSLAKAAAAAKTATEKAKEAQKLVEEAGKMAAAAREKLTEEGGFANLAAAAAAAAKEKAGPAFAAAKEFAAKHGGTRVQEFVAKVEEVRGLVAALKELGASLDEISKTAEGFKSKDTDAQAAVVKDATDVVMDTVEKTTSECHLAPAQVQEIREVVQEHVEKSLRDNDGVNTGDMQDVAKVATMSVKEKIGRDIAKSKGWAEGSDNWNAFMNEFMSGGRMGGATAAAAPPLRKAEERPHEAKPAPAASGGKDMKAILEAAFAKRRHLVREGSSSGSRPGSFGST